MGLGGRLDATNIVDPSVAVITSIALDHTDWLGNDRESIGREKAGIFRSGKPAVVGEPDMPNSIRQVAETLGAPLYRRGEARSFSEQGDRWQWQGGDTLLTDLPTPNVPLANAATALAALNCSPLEIDERAIFTGLQQATLPGRFQIVRREPTLILDVAHNPHAAGYLAGRWPNCRATAARCARWWACCRTKTSPARWPASASRWMNGTAHRSTGRAAPASNSWRNI